MPYPTPHPSAYPSDDEWWETRMSSTRTERRQLIDKPRTSPWTNTSIILCITVLVFVSITPTVIVTIVIARLGWNIEDKALPLADKALPIMQDAHDAVRTASITARLVHHLLNQSIPHAQRLPQAMDVAIGAMNDTRGLVHRLSHIAEHPSMTVNLGRM